MSDQTCPICGSPSDKALRPFCSKRCQRIDLGKWLNESYRIKTEEEPDPGQWPADRPPDEC